MLERSGAAVTRLFPYSEILSHFMVMFNVPEIGARGEDVSSIF